MGGVHVTAVNLALQLLETLLTHAAADNLADSGEEDVGALHGGSGGHAALVAHAAFTLRCVLLHVEGLDGGGVVGHDDGLLEVLLHEVALVLAGQVVAPVAGELELAAVLDGLLQDVDAFGVGQAHEGLLQHALQALDERLVDHLVEEGEVVLTVVEGPAHAVLDEVLLEVHELFLVHESNLGLYHPELGQMARRVAVLGAEGGAEGVDGTQRRGAELAFELSADGEAGLFAEEVVVVDDLTLFVLLQVVEVLGGHLEHVAGTFAVAGSDERCVEVEEAVLVEVGVDGHRHVMADAHHGPEGVRAQAHVGVLAHIFKGLSLLLHGVGGIARAEDFDLRGLDLHSLSGGGALYELSFDADAGSGGDELHRGLVEVLVFTHNLNVLDGGAVVEGDEEDAFGAALGTHPTFGTDSTSLTPRPPLQGARGSGYL